MYDVYGVCFYLGDSQLSPLMLMSQLTVPDTVG